MKQIHKILYNKPGQETKSLYLQDLSYGFIGEFVATLIASGNEVTILPCEICETKEEVFENIEKEE